MKTKTNDLDVNAQIALSKCCNAPTHIFPASLGEKSFPVCSHCNKETEIVYKPRFELISKGHWRRIKYTIDYNINQI